MLPISVGETVGRSDIQYGACLWAFNDALHTIGGQSLPDLRLYFGFVQQYRPHSGCRAAGTFPAEIASRDVVSLRGEVIQARRGIPLFANKNKILCLD